MFAPGEKIRQRKVDATAEAVFTASFSTEITKMVVCNLHNASSSFSIFHSDGEGFSAGNALYFSHDIGPRRTLIIDSQTPGNGIMMTENDILGFSNSKSATFTIYGVSRTAR